MKDKFANSLALGTSPIVRALIDPEGGMRDIRALDNISFADWFKSHGGSQGSIERMWDPIGALLSSRGTFILPTASSIVRCCHKPLFFTRRSPQCRRMLPPPVSASSQCMLLQGLADGS